MSPQRSCLVIGDAVLDARVAPSEPMRPAGDVAAAIRIAPGGQGANVAVRLARRGLDVTLACALADDVAGDMVRAALRADGVSVLDLGAATTGAVVVLLDEHGDRTMFSQRVPLARQLASGTIGSDDIVASDWLVVSGYCLLEGDTGLSATGPQPRRVALGCSLDDRQAAAWMDAAATLAPHLLILNRDEARVLRSAELEPAELSRDLGNRLGAIVVVTHAAGASAAIADDVVEVTGERVLTPIDTTGAGDAYAATLIAVLAPADWPPASTTLRQAMTEASAVASAVTLVPGAQGRVASERIEESEHVR